MKRNWLNLANNAHRVTLTGIFKLKSIKMKFMNCFQKIPFFKIKCSCLSRLVHTCFRGAYAPMGWPRKCLYNTCKYTIYYNNSNDDKSYPLICTIKPSSASVPSKLIINLVTSHLNISLWAPLTNQERVLLLR